MKLEKRKGGNIEQIVTTQTGMSVEMLMNDDHHYFYPKLVEAADFYLSHVAKGSKITFYGDYDVDGVISCSEFILLNKVLKFQAEVLAPRRFTDGYGINQARVEEIVANGTNLIITADNGIAAIGPIKYAREHGVDVVVIDHHEAQIDDDGNMLLPEANVLCDPHITGGDDTYGFDDLCGGGLMLHFCEYILNRANWIPDDVREDTIKKLYSLAALATVADVVKLIYDNRRIVKLGLEYLNEGCTTVGVKTLLEELNVERIDSQTIGFTLGPVINAMGRLHDDGAQQMVSLISTDTEAAFIAELCDAAKKANEVRKEETKNAVEEAMQEDFSKDTCVVYTSPKSLSGIAGLVAAKLAEKYKKPAICFMTVHTPDGKTIYKGSGRTFGDVNVLDSVQNAKPYTLGFGGHPEALGVSIDLNQLDEFKRLVNEATPKVDLPDVTYYDLRIDPSKSLWPILKELDRFEPYGAGNPKPKVGIEGFTLGNRFGNTYKLMGKDSEHIKLCNDNLDVVWFNGAEEYQYIGAPTTLDVCGDLSVNYFNGKKFIQVQLSDYAV